MELQRKSISADSLRYNRLPLEESYGHYNTSKLAVALTVVFLMAALVILMILSRGAI